MKRIAKISMLLVAMSIIMSSCHRGIGCPNNLGKAPQPHKNEKPV